MERNIENLTRVLTGMFAYTQHVERDFPLLVCRATIISDEGDKFRLRITLHAPVLNYKYDLITMHLSGLQVYPLRIVVHGESDNIEYYFYNYDDFGSTTKEMKENDKNLLFRLQKESEEKIKNVGTK